VLRLLEGIEIGKEEKKQELRKDGVLGSGSKRSDTPFLVINFAETGCWPGVQMRV
jgi:hypothetical protein